VVVGIGRRDNGEPKDTAKNIRTTGEFVVNMVTEDLLAAMNISAAEFPPDESELTAANLHAASSACVKPPRLAGARSWAEQRELYAAADR
jgi:flavin reductase (DIM6/NTAB) family NADH-FMN oxidoreductase RutF